MNWNTKVELNTVFNVYTSNDYFYIGDLLVNIKI